MAGVGYSNPLWQTLFQRQKNKSNQRCINRSNVGIKEIEENIWLANFMEYDLGYFDAQICKWEPLPNPFGAKVLPMSPI